MPRQAPTGSNWPMIRISHRQVSSSRHFVEAMAKIRASRSLTVGRMFVVRPVWNGPPDAAWVVTLSSEWPTGDRTQVTLDVVRTRQRVRGERWWWMFPRCCRRCFDVLSPAPSEPFACRRCWGAVYRSDYRRRPTQMDLLCRLLGTQPDPIDDLSRRFDELIAPRRRGVRRGRHLPLRAARLLVRILRHQRRSEGAALT